MALTVLLATVKGSLTLTLLLLDLAVMVVMPKAMPVARPELSMVAMFWAVEVHVTCEVTSLTVLLPSTAVAVNCCVFVGVIQPLGGDTVSDVISFDDGKKPLQLPMSTSDRAAAMN